MTIHSKEGGEVGISYDPDHTVVLQLGDVGWLVLGRWEAEENWKMIKKIVDHFFDVQREIRGNTTIFRQQKKEEENVDKK